ncbi:hypothetical protein L3V43_10200 [Pseudoalteromonas sp. L23]|uniref:hypothetical protein n=1 Tax=unclassified Pseudoalteromonas TaxID=194690 RepID=UPI001EF0CFA8|nr:MULTISPECIES: hypothetical protein [unclassified Pseudoalteromonas]MCF7514215.1 hypothetical protein [Pseudoalteromonas sp. L7]MCF7526031.1 hypothetical protein [Pseudoalteromonas sp. L23]MCX2769315.1 hypothetical protein [Pseudoalteromonas sp. B530]
MTYYAIEDASWPEILTLQSQAYHDVAPETVDILKSKWMRSPKSCFVFKQHRAVDAYLLAHPSRRVCLHYTNLPKYLLNLKEQI